MNRRQEAAFACGGADSEGTGEDTTMGWIVMLVVIVAAVYCLVKAWGAANWHNRGVGERAARAEFARMQREQPDSAEARLSESEFVNQYVAARPKAWRYITGTLLLVFIGMPLSAIWIVVSMIPD